MKYHTTVSNIVYALLILFGVVTAVIISSPLGISREIGTAVAKRMIEQFSGEGEHILSFGSVDSTLFSSITVRDLELSEADGTRLISAKRMSINVPVFRLLAKALYPREFDIEVESFDLIIDDRFERFLASFSSDTPGDDLRGIGVRITISDSDIAIRYPNLASDIKDIGGVVSLQSASLLKASLQTGELSLTGEQVNALSSNGFIEYGNTASGSPGLRLELRDTKAKSISPVLSGSASSLSLFVLADTLQEMLEGTGTALLESSGITGSLDAHTTGQMVSLQAQAELESFRLMQADASTSKLDISIGPWQFILDSLRTSLMNDGLNLSMINTSDATLLVHHEGFPVGEVVSPSFSYERSPTIEAARVASPSIASFNLAALVSRLGTPIDAIGHTELREAHLLAVRNQDNETVNLETSFTLDAGTTIPYFSQNEADVSGDMAFDGKFVVKSARAQVDSLVSSELPGEVSGEIQYTAEGTTGGAVSAAIQHSLGIQATIDYDLLLEQLRLSIRMSDFTPFPLSHVLEDIAAPAASLVVPETSLEGNINVQGKLDGSLGRGTAEIGVANLAVDEQRFNVATTLSGSLDEQSIQIDLATLTTEGFRLSYTGSIDRTGLIPEGTIDIREVDSGIGILAAEFAREAARKYRYGITSVRTPGSSLDGIISWTEQSVLAADAILTIPGMQYPVNVLFNVPAGVFTLESDNLNARFDLLSEPGHLAFTMDTNNLPLPPASGALFNGQGLVSGTLAADVSLADGLFLVQGESFSIDGLSWINGAPWSLGFSFEADPTEIRIRDLELVDRNGVSQGSLTINNGSLASLLDGEFNRFSLDVDLLGSDGSYIGAVIFPDDQNNSIARGAISASRFPVGRFLGSANTVLLDLEVVGETNARDFALGHASIDMLIGEITSASMIVHTEKEGLVVEDARLDSGIFGVRVDEALARFDGSVQISGELSMASPTTWRDGSSRFSFNAETRLDPTDSIFDWVRMIGDLKEDIPPFIVHHDEGRIYGLINWQEGTHELSFKDRLLTVKPLNQGTIEGSYDFSSGALSFRSFEGFPIPARVDGYITGNTISLDVRDILFDMRLLNAVFLEPIISFEGGVVTGQMLVEGPLDDPDYYGTLYGDTIEMTTFWTVGEYLSIKNPVVTVTENLATVAATPVSAVHESGRSTTATARLEATVERWNFPHYRIDILGIDDPISFWLPLYFNDINVHAMVEGNFSIDGTPFEETLYGDVTISDAMINFGVPAPPVWVVEKFRTNIDMTLRTGRNVSFIYPNEESPILRATFADNQAVDIRVTAPSMETILSGELALRSGEIYYVQKNFYVTEGSIKFPPIGGRLASDVLPMLTLRARLREFDTEGNRIDIYLVLQDASFDNLDPRFESIPLRTTNEILELLGQSIVAPGTVGDSGLESVVSVASAATDVITRLGLLQGTAISLGFSNIIRDSLGLDVFTIRSNLLQNILFEALPGIASDTSVTPLARYLDNTTVYIGKYIFDEFYLQGMLHFREDGFGNSTSFLANDLRIDTELSVEWANPLATFSLFTQPEELSVFDLFDTMGISVTKRFEF